MTTHFDQVDDATAARVGLIRPRGGTRKAVSGPGVATYYNGGPMLTSLLDTPQARAASFLRAYKVGWFYKAESRISTDISNLDRCLKLYQPDGSEFGVEPAPFSLPLAALSPEQGFLRLMERPNPKQTGRELFAQTMIRLDMAGTAFWYLESPSPLTGLPTAIYPISPARLTPSYDRSGALLGWVMDRNAGSRGVPFRADEILVFKYPSADDDVFGQGVVEAVWSEIPLSERMARHTLDVLDTGGRLAGMIWPKERALDEAEYVEAQRAWRNVTSDPNAARRMLIFPEPMEYAAGASTPAEIGIPELANLNRDNILSAFPIPQQMVGVPLSSGLNSGETMRYVRQEYWEGTIHPRVELLEEAIQTGLVSRLEAATGAAYEFDIEEPNLDDATSLGAKAATLRELIAIGFDAQQAAAAVGLDHIALNPVPAFDPFAGFPPVVADTPAPARTPVPASTAAQRMDGMDEAMGAMRSVKSLTHDERARMMAPLEEEFRQAFAEYLAAQRERLLERIRDRWPEKKAARKAFDETWWDQELEVSELERAIQSTLGRIGYTSARVVADRLGRTISPRQIERITDAALRASLQRLTGNVLYTTRTAVQDALAEGVRRGYSITQLVDGVPDEGFPGIRNATMGNGIDAWSEYRAEMVARTETMTAFNTGNLVGYTEFDVEQVEAVDGDDDEPCRKRNGQIISIADVLADVDGDWDEHPNGTLDFIPITKSARTEELTDMTKDELFAALKEAGIGSGASRADVSYRPDFPMPPITVRPPAVVVPPMDLGPIQETLKAVSDVLAQQAEMLTSLAASNAATQAELAELKKPRVKTVHRDERGQIIEIKEVVGG